jgi:hypothetical protein
VASAPFFPLARISKEVDLSAFCHAEVVEPTYVEDLCTLDSDICIEPAGQSPTNCQLTSELATQFLLSIPMG